MTDKEATVLGHSENLVVEEARRMGADGSNRLLVNNKQSNQIKLQENILSVLCSNERKKAEQYIGSYLPCARNILPMHPSFVPMHRGWVLRGNCGAPYVSASYGVLYRDMPETYISHRGDACCGTMRCVRTAPILAG